MQTDKTAFIQMKYAVVDDHDLVREGLERVLLNHGVSDIRKFSLAKDLLCLLDGGIYCDFFIIDLELPDMDGFALITEIRSRIPEARIIVSTVHDEIWTLRRLLASNVDAIIYKSGVSVEIINAIEEILEGNRYYCREVHDALRLAEDKSMHPSSRELEVLRNIAKGRTTKEIGDALFVSENTVEAHRKALLSKMGAVNVADLIMKAVEKGYISKNI